MVASQQVLELSLANSSGMKLSHHAARSIGWSEHFCSMLCQPSTLRIVICPDASNAQNNIAAVSAEGKTVCVLMRRLNSSCKRSIALVVRIERHCSFGNSVNV